MTDFRYRFRPRYYEIDRQGVLFNMWYLGYVDTAMGDFYADRGTDYEAMLAAGYDCQVVHVELDYAAGLTDERDTELVLRAGAIGTKSFTIDFVFVTDLDADEPTEAVAGRIVYAVIAADGSGSIPIPDALREVLQS
ncbi:acyl-CoA thioesterase [Tsukamurella asaccharolytica]|uniref:Acyl-CoA thioesterase n=1 Tax=Tsukamurella asaccharolytica TaxID=2592067 RepID=A0A5C5RAT5_9ACTN|nr:thioesterase family protein [Tsukamurella asaccharolytica]TWS20040.1 acyl-CoA thioesterase [Tsukamurella asaccharolytica]